jgi:SAM-dependent methyltransferase
VEKQWVFDSDLARNYTEVRQTFIGEFLAGVRKQVELTTALDVGCGVGYFSQFLSGLGFRVVAIDGRSTNIQEAKKRWPEIAFLTRNAEDPALPEIGTFDFVLCVGLLYHLENPFLAIRNLCFVTGKLLAIESMCAPGDHPSMELLDEYHEEDQGLEHFAFYPTESCLVKMLYRAGFPFVYGFKQLPDHPAFRATRARHRERTMLVASHQGLNMHELTQIVESKRPWDIWSKAGRFGGMRAKLGKVERMIRNSIKTRALE